MHIVYALIETFFVSEPEQYNYNRTFRKKKLLIHIQNSFRLWTDLETAT